MGIRIRFTLILGIVAAACLILQPVGSEAFMPPPHPCELEPMTYSPPSPPQVGGPPPPPMCGPCLPMRQYPRKIVGPPPCSIIVCKFLPSKPADFRIAPPPACPPPPCAPVSCTPDACGY